MLALIRLCGIRQKCMYTCESPTQVFLFLLRAFVRDANSVLRLRYLGYDRACDLKPFLMNQAKNGSAGAKLLLGSFTAISTLKRPVCLLKIQNVNRILSCPSLQRFMEQTLKVVSRVSAD